MLLYARPWWKHTYVIRIISQVMRPVIDEIFMNHVKTVPPLVLTFIYARNPTSADPEI